MKKRQFTFLENKLIFLDGAAPGQSAEQPPADAPKVETPLQINTQPQAAEAIPVQPEAAKGPEKMPVSPDAPAQLNTQTKEAAAKKIDSAQNHLNTLANITV
jgi:hypothetical protein